jgi:hypothetical protein
MLERMWGKKGTLFTAGGNVSYYNTLENNMEASLKTKHRSAI